MRVNARLDEESQEQVNYLVATTGQGVSLVVREAIAVYHAQVKARQPGPRRLLAMIGKGHSGRMDVASNVKRYVAEALEAKYPQHTRPKLPAEKPAK